MKGALFVEQVEAGVNTQHFPHIPCVTPGGASRIYTRRGVFSQLAECALEEKESWPDCKRFLGFFLKKMSTRIVICEPERERGIAGG